MLAKIPLIWVSRKFQNAVTKGNGTFQLYLLLFVIMTFMGDGSVSEIWLRLKDWFLCYFYIFNVSDCIFENFLH